MPKLPIYSPNFGCRKIFAVFYVLIKQQFLPRSLINDGFCNSEELVRCIILLLIHRGVRCLFTDETKKKCDGSAYYGLALWTAGQRTDPDSESAFVWKVRPGDEHPLTYTFWYPGQPDSGARESCLILWYPKYGYRWNDAPCRNKHCFVCEAEF